MSITDLIEAKRAERAGKGMNVEIRHPSHNGGQWDCWSFRDAARASAFKAAKAAEGFEVRGA